MKHWVAAALLLVSMPLLSAQPADRSAPSDTALWEPLPPPPFDKLPDATGGGEMITRLTIFGFPVALQSTSLESARKHFGAEMGSKGDAGEAQGWVCLQGSDDDGPWVLWLLSNEIDGPAVGGFEWLRIDSATKVDPRCKRLANGSDVVQLPVALHLGMSIADAEEVIGTPSGLAGRSRVYVHERALRSNGKDYAADNTVYLRFRQKRLRAIRALYTVTN